MYICEKDNFLLLAMKNKAPKRPFSLAVERSLIVDKLPGYFLIFCLVVAFYFLLYFLSPFLTVIFIGIVLTVSFYPLYKVLLRWFRGWSRVASLTSCVLMIILILVPLTLMVLLLTSEAVNTYHLIQQKIESGVFDKYFQYFQWNDGGFLYNLKMQIAPVIDLGGIDVKKTIIEWAQSLSGFLVSQTTNLVKEVSWILFSIIVLMFSMYYFFKDGPKLVKRLGELSPLPSVYESQLFSKIGSMIKAIVFGVFLTAIIQGALGGIGFAIAGISNPIFWGAAMAFFSLLPVFGTGIIWVPAMIILAILGNYGACLFLFLWGFFLVGTADNFLRPYLIGGKAHTYPLLTFLVVLGGVIVMGLKGVLVGPLVLMILMAFLEIYESEYKKILK